MAASKSALLIFLWFLLILSDIADIAFAVDGNWSEWWEWEPCSASCGKGTRRRFRLCNNPPRSNGGADCAGKATQKMDCRVSIECPVDGGWSEWTRWTHCSVTCGEGTMTRSRECNSPPPANGGRNCEGSEVERIRCVFAEHCPRDGKWSSWGQWSLCSVTCGSDGSMTRQRSCNNPPPSPDGRNCLGDNSQARRCRAPSCSVNGHWSKWSDWSPCSVTCGTGGKRRWRKCDNPPPQNGGLDCSRDEAGEMQESSCNGSLVFCPVNGGWSDWGEWGKCNSPNCASPKEPSYVIRERSCNNPYPDHHGNMCQGTFLNAAICDKPVNCPVDGGWSEWSDWICQRNSVTRTRKCDNPVPANGGRQCLGEKAETYIDEDEEYEKHCSDFIPDPEEDEDEDIEHHADGVDYNKEEEEDYEEDYEE